MLSVLIIDDLPVIVKKLKELLYDMALVNVVDACHTFDNALQVLPSAIPDIVLLDINLAGKSGVILLRYIKRNLPGTFVIVITNHCEDQYSNVCLKAGADAFIDKSNVSEKLCPVIHLLLHEDIVHAQ